MFFFISSLMSVIKKCAFWVLYFCIRMSAFIGPNALKYTSLWRLSHKFSGDLSVNVSIVSSHKYWPILNDFWQPMLQMPLLDGNVSQLPQNVVCVALQQGAFTQKEERLMKNVWKGSTVRKDKRFVFLLFIRYNMLCHGLLNEAQNDKRVGEW